MVTLYHHPFCPHSRFVRVAMAEYGIEPELIEEKVWERRREFLTLSPEGITPLMLEDGVPPIPGAEGIAEYLDETVGAAFGDRRLLPAAMEARVEARRLAHWFNGKFFSEVSQWLVEEKVYKRFRPSDRGGGGPNMDAVRAARMNLRYHLKYIGRLMATRKWLAGDRLTYADLAAAAHLSCVDYLGDAPWNESEIAKDWYARVKSRPSFRPLLVERLPGTAPSPTYADLDF